jgi:hypothetical protein
MRAWEQRSLGGVSGGGDAPLPSCGVLQQRSPRGQQISKHRGGVCDCTWRTAGLARFLVRPTAPQPMPTLLCV